MPITLWICLNGPSENNLGNVCVVPLTAGGRKIMVIYSFAIVTQAHECVQWKFIKPLALKVLQSSYNVLFITWKCWWVLHKAKYSDLLLSSSLKRANQRYAHPKELTVLGPIATSREKEKERKELLFWIKIILSQTITVNAC